MTIREAERSVRMKRSRPPSGGAQLASGLGWFGIGLGMAELTAAEAVARAIGVPSDDGQLAVLRTAGVREIASGLGILAKPQSAAAVWNRVAGDVMDLCLLGFALGDRQTDRKRLAMAGVAVAGVTALDLLAAQQLQRNGGDLDQTWSQFRDRAGALTQGVRDAGRRLTAPIEVTKVVTVNRLPEDVYQFWRNFENLPRFMSHLQSVRVDGQRRSHWKTKGPAGTSVEWDAEMTEDRPNELIAWRSMAGADVQNRGRVQFAAAPGGRGTEVRVQLDYRPPAGAAGALMARLFGEAPEQQIGRDLRQFKAVMETGEVVHSDASIHRGPHPALPVGSRHS